MHWIVLNDWRISDSLRLFQDVWDCSEILISDTPLWCLARWNENTRLIKTLQAKKSMNNSWLILSAYFYVIYRLRDDQREKDRICYLLEWISTDACRNSPNRRLQNLTQLRHTLRAGTPGAYRQTQMVQTSIISSLYTPRPNDISQSKTAWWQH